MNPNHPHYAGLGGGPNLNLLDNMLMAAGFQVIHLLFEIFFVNLIICGSHYFGKELKRIFNFFLEVDPFTSSF